MASPLRSGSTQGSRWFGPSLSGRRRFCTAGEHLQFLGFPWHFPVLGMTYLRCAEAEPFPPTRLPPGIRQAIGRTKRWFFLFSRKWFPVVPFGSREPVGIGSPVPRYRDREPGTAHSAVKSFPLFTYPTARRPSRGTAWPSVTLHTRAVPSPRSTYPSRTRTSMAISVLSFLPPARLAAWFFVNSPGCCSITSHRAASDWSDEKHSARRSLHLFERPERR